MVDGLDHGELAREGDEVAPSGRVDAVAEPALDRDGEPDLIANFANGSLFRCLAGLDLPGRSRVCHLLQAFRPASCGSR